MLKIDGLGTFEDFERNEGDKSSPLCRTWDWRGEKRRQMVAVEVAIEHGAEVAGEYDE
jgi:hypothetical protein